MIECYAARHLPQVRPIFGESIQQAGDRGFAFANPLNFGKHLHFVYKVQLAKFNQASCPRAREAAKGAVRVNSFHARVRHLSHSITCQ